MMRIEKFSRTAFRQRPGVRTVFRDDAHSLIPKRAGIRRFGAAADKPSGVRDRMIVDIDGRLPRAGREHPLG